MLPGCRWGISENVSLICCSSFTVLNPKPRLLSVLLLSWTLGDTRPLLLTALSFHLRLTYIGFRTQTEKKIKKSQCQRIIESPLKWTECSHDAGLCLCTLLRTKPLSGCGWAAAVRLPSPVSCPFNSTSLADVAFPPPSLLEYKGVIQASQKQYLPH